MIWLPCAHGLTLLASEIPVPDAAQAVRVEHMDSDDLWELQAGRWHSPVLPLLASHVLAKRAGLGRAAGSVCQRTRWVSFRVMRRIAAASASLFGQPESAVRPVAYQYLGSSRSPFNMIECAWHAVADCLCSRRATCP